MPLPLLPVLATVVEFIIANGTRTAITKFGQQAVKQATKQMSNFQKKQAQKNILNKQGTLQADRALVNSRVEQQLARQGPAPRFNQAERIRGQEAIKVKGRNQRIEGQAPSRRFDAEGDPIEGIPLQFALGDEVQGIESLMGESGRATSNVDRQMMNRLMGGDPVIPRGTRRAISDEEIQSAMNKVMANQGARQGISPVEQRMQMLQQTLEQSGRTISDEDASLFAMGEISFEDAMGRATSIPRSGAMAMQQPNAQLQMAEGGEASMDEVQEGLNELQGQQPEIEAMNQLIASVVEMVMSGVSEEEIMQFLSSKGLDDEEIQLVLQAAGDQLMQQQGQQQDQQQDPIQAEISQMA